MRELGDSQRPPQTRASDEDRDPLRHGDAEQLMQRLLDSPDAMQALTQALTPIVGQASRGHLGEDGNSTRGEDPMRMRAYEPLAMQPVSGRSPTQGGPHPMQGILEHKQGCLHPMQGTCTPSWGSSHHSPSFLCQCQDHI